MSKLLATIKAYWTQMDARDRVTFQLGGMLVLVLLIVGLIVVPALESYKNLQASVPRARKQLDTMRAQSLEVKRLRSNPSAQHSGESILSLLETSTTVHGIRSQVESLTPRTGQAAAIRFKNVEYSRLIKWMAGLRSQYHLQAIEAELSRASDPGIVDAYLVFPDPADHS